MLNLEQIKQDERTAFELLCKIADDINAYAKEIIESDTAFYKIANVTALVTKNRDRFNTFEAIATEYAKKNVLIQYLSAKSNMHVSRIELLAVGRNPDSTLMKQWD